MEETKEQTKTRQNAVIRNLRDWGIFIVFPALLFFLFQAYYSTPFDEVHLTAHRTLFSILLFEGTALFLSFLIGKPRIALWIQGGSCIFFGLLDSYVFLFRGSFLAPWDIFSVQTALGVAGNFSFLPTGRMVIVTLLIVLWGILAGFCRLKLKNLFPREGFRYLFAALSLVLVLALGFSIRSARIYSHYLDLNSSLFGDEKNRVRDGALLRMIHESRYLNVEKPEGYDSRKQAGLIASYGGENQAAPEILPDIVVIMDEAFSDLLVRGEFTTNKDPMPFIHSLEKGAENTVTGILNTSVKGGNTPNTEFEFLTGSSMAFFPSGSTPYQQYLRREVDTLCTHLKPFGYRTVASHPYEANGWNRPRVYPLLGFDERYFVDYYETKNPDYVRDYISDDSFFRMVMDDIDERSSEGPVFSFNVTMQNHSGYEEVFDNFRPEIEAENTENITEKRMLRFNQYLSLVLLTDRALENLIHRLEKRERPVVVLFFGDHEPADNTSYLITDRNARLGIAQGDEENWNRYKVPFVLWANFDIPEETGVELSVNYLGGFLLEKIGMPLSNYQNFLKEVEEAYPVFSAVRAVDASGLSRNTEEVMGEEIIQQYQSMQYYEMFDDSDAFR